MKFRATIDGKTLAFEIHREGKQITVVHDGSADEIDFVRLTPHSYSVLMEGKSHHLSITEQLNGYKVVIDQHPYEVQITDETDLLLEQAGIPSASKDTPSEIRAPIPGLVTTIFVKPGQRINQGEKLMILEAMKMENEIDASMSGTVENVAVTKGQSVEKNTLLVSILRGDHGNG